MNVQPENCIVIEDAVNGVQAAIAAGMKCIAISTSFAENELKNAGADYVCDRIDDVFDLVNDEL
jgi:beta-phosphoglucomutase-like phosphatase (HAD superfamily)